MYIILNWKKLTYVLPILDLKKAFDSVNSRWINESNKFYGFYKTDCLSMPNYFITTRHARFQIMIKKISPNKYLSVYTIDWIKGMIMIWWLPY